MGRPSSSRSRSSCRSIRRVWRLEPTPRPLRCRWPRTAPNSFAALDSRRPRYYADDFTASPHVHSSYRHRIRTRCSSRRRPRYPQRLLELDTPRSSPQLVERRRTRGACPAAARYLRPRIQCKRSAHWNADCADAFAFFVKADDSAGHAVQKAYAPHRVALDESGTDIDERGAFDGSAGSRQPAVGVDRHWLRSDFAGALGWCADRDDVREHDPTCCRHPAPSLVNAGTHQLAVQSPAPGGGTSGSVPFVVTAVARIPLQRSRRQRRGQRCRSHRADDAQIAIVGPNYHRWATSATIGGQDPDPVRLSNRDRCDHPRVLSRCCRHARHRRLQPTAGRRSAPSTVTITVGNLNPVPTLGSPRRRRLPLEAPASRVNLSGSNFVRVDRCSSSATALATAVTNRVHGSGDRTCGAHHERAIRQRHLREPHPRWRRQRFTPIHDYERRRGWRDMHHEAPQPELLRDDDDGLNVKFWLMSYPLIDGDREVESRPTRLESGGGGTTSVTPSPTSPRPMARTRSTSLQMEPRQWPARCERTGGRDLRHHERGARRTAWM